MSTVSKVSRDAQDDVEIKLRREGKGVHSAEYNLTIYNDGTVIYKGIKNVKVLGEQISHISQDDLNRLINDFIDIYYFALKERYEARDNSASSAVTTSFRLEKKSKSVYHELGSQEANQLTELENKIDKITNSSQWTGID